MVETPHRVGPAAARNAGAADATGDVLVFIDSDVAVHPDCFTRIRAAFAADPELVALFGSYDDDPRSGGAVSDFRNLLHHHVHQDGAGPASTFWAGLGAVRRTAFDEVGGFDAERYPVPSIEDIELGVRLHAAGAKIVLDPALQGTHLKRWTFAQMLRTDVFHRGVPWLHLMLERPTNSAALNLGWRHRLAVLMALVAVAATLRGRFVAATACFAAVGAADGRFLALLLRRRGRRAAALGVPLLVVHRLVAATAAAVGVWRYLRTLSRRARDD